MIGVYGKIIRGSLIQTGVICASVILLRFNNFGAQKTHAQVDRGLHESFTPIELGAVDLVSEGVNDSWGKR